MATQKGLGKGLGALFGDINEQTETPAEGAVSLPLQKIEPNPLQPRKTFDPDELASLAESIRMHGIIQPLTVRKLPSGFYQIIAGERRWRAAKMAGLSEVPVLVKDLSDESAAAVSLVENLQRTDLNPIEEASGYRDLIDAFGLTQEEAARRVGKSRASVTNMLRLLALPQKVQDLCIDGSLSYGHARSLLPLCGAFGDDEVCACADSVVRNGLSVRETERYVKLLLDGRDREQPGGQLLISRTYYKQLESKAGGILGRRVTIRRKPNGSGSLALAYSSADDLERLMKTLCGEELFSEEE
mgnify:CR=1 FL=1